jgi:hypothetical protein
MDRCSVVLSSHTVFVKKFAMPSRIHQDQDVVARGVAALRHAGTAQIFGLLAVRA